jgi:hypothetical protein
MNWNAEQQRMLGAMGFELMVQATMAASSAVALSFAASASNGAPAGPTAADFPELLRALRRAAGDQDVSGLVDDLERLRREPALKRALWPRLRALRRSH